MTEIHDALLAVISAWEADVQESEHLREIEAAYFDRTHGEMVRKLLDAQARIEALEKAVKALRPTYDDVCMQFRYGIAALAAKEEKP